MSERSVGLDSCNIISILPQKPPATLVDRVTDLDPGERITTEKLITVSEPAFAGHFPGHPIWPNSMLIEVWVQTCCLLAYATEQFEPGRLINLVGINKAKFHRVLGPGNAVELEATLLRQRSNVWRFSCTAFEGDLRVAEAELAISIHDRSSTL